MQPTWTNPVRVRLQAGQPVLGLTIMTNNVETATHGASLGFDFLWVEMEHGPLSLETLRTIVLATRSLPATVFARVPVNELWTAKRVLDQGVTGVIFPFSGTPELAAQAVAACKYPPRGKRGSGAGLARTSWPDTEDYYDSADRNVLTIVVIEEERAIERIEDIAAIEGIDVLFIGTSDLSFSLGLRGRQDEPRLQSAIDRVVAAAGRHGRFLGRPAADARQIARYREQGFLFFQTGTELSLMTEGARLLRTPSGGEVPVSDPRTLY